MAEQHKIPPALEELTELFSKFPGIGKKSALRMSMTILREPRDKVLMLAKALMKVKDDIKDCSICGNISQNDPCYICVDSQRDHSIICVVEEYGDILSIEKGGSYRGLYHVLGGVISPLDGIGPAKLELNKLKHRAESDEVKEVILATNPTSEGDATALFIDEMLTDSVVTVSRIARGIPVGGDLEYTDPATIARAMEGRGKM
ncbi:MAG: recombination protein RecR [FCB group bacterium]|nr:recombination protein RecR [FCB group bacterium]